MAELVDARDLKSLPPNQIIDDFWKTRGLDPMEINGTKRVLENAPLSQTFSSGVRTADVGHSSCGSYSMIPLGDSELAAGALAYLCTRPSPERE